MGPAAPQIFLSVSLFHMTEMQAASMSSEAFRDGVLIVYLGAGIRGAGWRIYLEE